MFPRLGFSGKRKRSVSTEVLFVVVMHGLERRPDVLGLGVDAIARTNTTRSATPNSSGSTSTAPTPRPSTNRSPPSRTASSLICPMPLSSATASLSWSTPAETTSSRTSPACPTPSTASSSPCSRAAARARKPARPARPSSRRRPSCAPISARTSPSPSWPRRSTRYEDAQNPLK